MNTIPVTVSERGAQDLKWLIRKAELHLFIFIFKLFIFIMLQNLGEPGRDKISSHRVLYSEKH